LKLSGNKFSCYPSCLTTNTLLSTDVASAYPVCGPPTLLPTSLSPTQLPLSPTNVPTPKPVGVPTPLPSPYTSPKPTGVQKCIRLSLLDSFGDGWDRVRLVVYPSGGDRKHYWYSPPCGVGYSYEQYCFDESYNEDGDYVIVKILGFAPDYDWEIKWQAAIMEDTSKTYNGNFDTVLTFTYHTRWAHGHWQSSISLAKAEKLDDNSKCDSCVSYTGVAPDAAVLQQPMLSGYGMTWHYGDGTGTNFYVSDTLGTNLLYSGTLCESKQAACGMSLPSGRYEWRVTGATDKHKNTVTWKFCGVKGHASVSMIFDIKGWLCKPVGDMKNMTQICSSHVAETVSMALEDTVTLRGVVQLQRAQKDILGAPLSDEETNVVASVLKQEFDDAQVVSSGSSGFASDVTSVNILSAEIHPREADTRSLTASSADLGTDLHHVTFSVTVSRSLVMSNGRDSSPVGALVTYLRSSMSSGLFITRLHNGAHKADVTSLSDVSSASLITLNIIHNTVVNVEKSIFADAVVGLSAVSGAVFAFMMILSFIRRKRIQDYQYSRVETVNEC